MRITQYEIDLMKKIEQTKDAETAKTLKRKLKRFHRRRLNKGLNINPLSGQQLFNFL
jgi:hypothetical protein